MIASIATRLLGGYWKVRNLHSRTQNPLRQKALSLLLRAYLYEKGSYIGLTSQFESTPTFPHGITGIFISNGAKIGRDCVIFQHVTIGSNDLHDSRGQGAPEIGTGCYIGVGAKIIGKVKLGNNVRVGAGAVVFKDVPDNCVVVAGPPRVIQKNSLDNTFRSYRNQE